MNPHTRPTDHTVQDSFLRVPADMNTPNCGILTIANDAAQYHEMAKSLALSIRRFNPAIPLAVVTDRPTAAERCRIYVSRSRAESRRICNEQQLSQRLCSQGFREVFLEDLSFSEQVRLFASASHVVAVHGSGLTNVLFASWSSNCIPKDTEYAPNIFSCQRRWVTSTRLL